MLVEEGEVKELEVDAEMREGEGGRILFRTSESKLGIAPLPGKNDSVANVGDACP